MNSTKFKPVPGESPEEPSQQEKPHFHPKSFIQRCGRLGIVSSALSIVFIAASLVVLNWAWFNSQDDKTWRGLITSGWLPRTIALCSLVIRWSVSFQATIATSMLAAIVLERHGISLERLATVSIIRHSNTGPLDLAQQILLTEPSSFRNLRLVVLKACVVLLLLTSILLQFTSTVLLSDLTQDNLPGSVNRIDSLFTFSPNQTYLEFPQTADAAPYYASDNLADFPDFAEYSEAMTPDWSMSDTGPSFRAFLPIPQQDDREDLLKYQGKATVVDTRVVCFAPTFINPGFSALLPLAGINSPLAYTFGSLVVPIVNESLVDDRDLDFRFAKGGVQASATNLVPANSTFPESRTIIKRLPNAACGQLSPLNPGTFPVPCGVNSTWNNSKVIKGASSINYDVVNTSLIDKSSTNLGSAWMVYTNLTRLDDALIAQMDDVTGQVLNLGVNNGGPEDVSGIYVAAPDTAQGQFKNNFTWASMEFDERGAWSDVSIKYNGSNSYVFSASICYDALRSTPNMDIMASRSNGYSEPRLMHNYTDKEKYDTWGVRRQLGVLPHYQSLSDRGLFQLQDRPRGNSSSTNSTLAPPIIQIDPFNGISTADTGPVLSVAVCKHCQNELLGRGQPFAARNTTIQVLQDIVDTTQNPALLVQAFLTESFRTAYYSSLPFFGAKDHPSTQIIEPFLIPQRYRGLVAVMVVLLVHLALVALIAWLFVSGSRISLVKHSAWQAVAQAWSAEAPEELRDMAMSSASDGDIRKMLRGRGCGSNEVLLVEKGGRVDLVNGRNELGRKDR